MDVLFARFVLFVKLFLGMMHGRAICAIGAL